MHRREFLATGAVLACGASHLRASPAGFRLNFAPHIGMFRNLAGDDPADQVRFVAERGFCVLEEPGLKQRSPAWQRRVAREMERHGMSMGAFTATADFCRATFASENAEQQRQVVEDVRKSLELARRMNAGWLSIVPGRLDPRLRFGRQLANAAGLLSRCVELCERANCAIVLEPLNLAGMLLQNETQARTLCRDVNSPLCTMLFDVSAGPVDHDRLISAIDACWSEIGYFRLGDYPGRKEPGTGQIDFRRLLTHVASRGFDGVLGMDHGNSQPGEEGELRVLEEYRALSRA